MVLPVVERAAHQSAAGEIHEEAVDRVLVQRSQDRRKDRRKVAATVETVETRVVVVHTHLLRQHLRQAVLLRHLRQTLVRVEGRVVVAVAVVVKPLF